MAKAGWIFTPCVDDGSGRLVPYMPSGDGLRSLTNPIDIFRLSGSPTPHVHFMSGSLAAPNMVLGDGHWHAAIRAGDVYRQWTIGAPDHEHEDLERPTWFMPFVVCSDAYALLINSDPACHIVATCEIMQEPDGSFTIGPEDETPWTSGERSTWVSRFNTALGLTLPTEVDRPNRLVLFVIGLNARRYSDAAPLRPSSV